MRKVTGLAAGMILALTAAAWAVSPAEVDDFQDGTFENWTGGVSLTNVPNGGPLGLGDRYLNVSSFNRLATYNINQWTGDYQAAGVLDIGVDMRNPNAEPLEMRIVLFSPNDTRYTSATPHVVPGDSQWHHYVFSLRESDLIVVQDLGTSYGSLMTNMARLMFRYDDVGMAGGTPYIGQMGIDNVTAIVPEPSLAAAALLGVLVARRNRAAALRR